MITHSYHQFILLIAWLLSINCLAQSDINTINLKKGQVFDILLISTNPDTKDELKDYFKDVYPTGTALSYKPLPGYKITALTAGNLKANSLLFGTWDNINLRETFLDTITTVAPDFHDRRRTIWSYFGLTYYEIDENMSFSIDKTKYNVVTSYWSKSNTSLDGFNKRQFDLINHHGGQLIVSFEDGTSPYGYYYQPDILSISSWNSEEDFISYQQAAMSIPHDNIQHINQFVL